MIKVTTEDFSLDDLVAPVRNPGTGAIVVFVGTVRGISKGRKVKSLVFESYREMAEAQLAKLAHEAKEKFGLMDVSIIHRTGTLPVGENIVGIAVGSGHRDEAYRASRFIIDKLKEKVVIWKKEIGENGEKWVENEKLGNKYDRENG